MGKSERINVLDIIKGIMIIFVIITHYKFIYPEDYRKYGFFFYIDMAVPIFLLITGYLSSISFEKKNITLLSQAISIEIVIPKIIRFLVPYFMVFAAEVILLIHENQGLIIIISQFLGGGYGPGAYYTVILMQLVWVIPVIYVIVKKYDFFAVIVCFIFTGMWEAVQFSWGLNDVSYARICFRYVSTISLGCYMSIGKVRLKKWMLVLMFAVGCIWQTMLNYIPMNPVLMNVAWARVNYLSSIFVFPVFYIVIKSDRLKKIKMPILQQIGKASYNIYLTQMLFYGFIARKIYMIFSGTITQLCICITICCFGGYLFYVVESRITQRILVYLKEKNYFKSEFAKFVDLCNDFFNENGAWR